MTNLTEKIDELQIQLATQHGAMMIALNALVASLNQIKTDTANLAGIKIGTDNLAGIKIGTDNLVAIKIGTANLAGIKIGTDNLAGIKTDTANLAGIRGDTPNLGLIYGRLLPMSSLTAIQAATTGTQTATQTALLRLDSAQITRLSLLSTLSGIATDTLQMPALLETIAECSCREDAPPAGICAGYDSSISVQMSRAGTYNVRSVAGGGGGGYAVGYMLQFSSTPAFSTTLLSRQYTGTPAYTFDVDGITNPGVICATDGNPMKFTNSYPFEIYLFTAQQGSSFWFRKAIAPNSSYVVQNTTNDMIFCVGCNDAPPLADSTTVTICYGVEAAQENGLCLNGVELFNASIGVLSTTRVEGGNGAGAAYSNHLFLHKTGWYTSASNSGGAAWTNSAAEPIFYPVVDQHFSVRNNGTRGISLLLLTGSAANANGYQDAAIAPGQCQNFNFPVDFNFYVAVAFYLTDTTPVTVNDVVSFSYLTAP